MICPCIIATVLRCTCTGESNMQLTHVYSTTKISMLVAPLPYCSTWYCQCTNAPLGDQRRDLLDRIQSTVSIFHIMSFSCVFTPLDYFRPYATTSTFVPVSDNDTCQKLTPVPLWRLRTPDQLYAHPGRWTLDTRRAYQIFSA